MAEPRKAKEDVPAWEVLRNGFSVTGWPTCYERVFEPKTTWLSGATRMTACMTESWFHLPLSQAASNRRAERPCGGFSVATLSASSSAYNEDIFLATCWLRAIETWGTNTFRYKNQCLPRGSLRDERDRDSIQQPLRARLTVLRTAFTFR